MILLTLGGLSLYLSHRLILSSRLIFYNLGAKWFRRRFLMPMVAYRVFCQLVNLAEINIIADDYNYAVAA